MKSVLIIDYKMGNVSSVANAFEMLGAQVLISNHPSDIERADRLVLPGVGAFGEGIKRLSHLNLIAPLKSAVIDKQVPFLGICLGMQLLATKGFEFGESNGLGWVPGEVKRLSVGDLRLPHVGWNNLRILNTQTLLNRVPNGSDFYFVHSYHFMTQNSDHVLAECDYGERFNAAIARDNIFGVQFHPEKSQKAGMLLLNNFLHLK